MKRTSSGFPNANGRTNNKVPSLSIFARKGTRESFYRGEVLPAKFDPSLYFYNA